MKAEASKRYRLDESIPYLMNRIVGHLNRGLDVELRARGLGFQYWRVLAVLAMADNRTIADLAGYAVVPHSTLSRLLTRMERQQLVRRTGTDADLRLAKIVLTTKGRSTYAAILPAALGWSESALAGLPRADIQRLEAILVRMLANVTAVDPGKKTGRP